MGVEASSSSNTKNLSLTCKQALCSHMKVYMRRQEQESSSSEDDGDKDEDSDEEDEQRTSSDEEIDSKIVKLISRLEKDIKRINAKIDHPIIIKDLVNTIDHIKKEKKKTKKKRETKGRAKALLV